MERGTETSLSYERIDGPDGDLLVFATTEGLVRLAFLAIEDAEAVMHEVATRVSPRLERSPRAFDAFRDQLDGYLAGRRRQFDHPVDLRLAPPFAARVLAALEDVPAGRTTTYRQLAEDVGAPGAARAVGNACASNPVPFVIPCHRVLRSDGAIGGYRGGPALKHRLLHLEGMLAAAS